MAWFDSSIILKGYVSQVGVPLDMVLRPHPFVLTVSKVNKAILTVERIQICFTGNAETMSRTKEL